MLVLTLCHASYAISATILADTNRDGIVDVEGSSDVAGKHIWTPERGAFFLPNVVDTDRRCSSLPATVETMHLCHDATDNILRQAKYLAPLRTLPARDVGNNAFGTVNVTTAAAIDRVRVFVKEGDKWTYVERDRRFSAAELKAGLILGIDGRDVRRPNVWDGKAVVQFSITDGATVSTDSVELRVAPYLTHHPVQLAQQVFASVPGPNSLAVFNDELTKQTKIAGIDQPPIFLTGRDIWTQDTFEPGYASIPGPNGPIVIRIMLAAYARRGDTLSLFQTVRNSNVGVLNFPETWQQPVDFGSGTWDSTGNLETVPPYTHNGKAYPAGRIIIGEGEKRPSILPFLQLQEVQEPIVLDTSWLSVGHVDEFVQFLPANNTRGWLVMADDPLAGLAILKKAAADGHGGVQALNRPVFSYDPLENGWKPACTPKSTINYELSRPNLEGAAKYAAERIEYNLNILKRETGITDAEIFRVPGVVFSGDKWTCNNSPTGKVASAKFAQSTQVGEDHASFDIVKAAGGSSSSLHQRQLASRVHAHYPAAINGVILSDSYYLAPKQWGPIIDGVDILAEAVTAAYAKVNFTVGFIDTWFTHHLGGGEVHCGSNVWREPDSNWW